MIRTAIHHHPEITHHTENICLAIAVEIPEPQIRDAVDCKRKVRELADTAIGNKPLASVGIEDIGAMIAIKVADDEIAQRRIAFVDLLPGRNATPGDEPIAAMLS